MTATLDKKLDDDFTNVVEFVKECNLEQVASLSEDQGSNILAVRSVQQVTQSCLFYIRSYALFCPFFEP